MGRPLMPPDLVDAVDGHLRADQGGLAAGRSGAGERLQGADLVGLRLAEGCAPRRRHQHGGAQGAGGRRAVAEEPAARGLAAVPEVLGPVLLFPILSHRAFLPADY